MSAFDDILQETMADDSEYMAQFGEEMYMDNLIKEVASIVRRDPTFLIRLAQELGHDNMSVSEE